jgi:hypothetical protein
MCRSVKVASHRVPVEMVPELLELRDIAFQRHNYLMPVGVKNIAPDIE